VTADQALAELLSGNLRYIGQQPHMAHRTAERRAEIAPGQHPIAVVVCCSDSRVPPEVVFDQGLGDLFVVRQAGGTVGGLALGSIVYGVTHLRAPLVVVLGHSRCGAITAVVDGREATGHLGKVLAAIRPSVEQARALGGDLVETAVRAHTQRTVALLRDNTELAALEQTRTLKITGAHYDLVTGLVTLVP
jgi:carbonic anhydrase